MVPCQLPAELTLLVAQLAQPLHARLAGRLLPLLLGMLFARGRRTAASWLRGGGLGRDYQPYYYFLGSLGRKTASVAALLLLRAVGRLAVGDRLLLALDDTPTERYGPLVEGAGVHHNPTPGPAGRQFLYGHVWVTLAWVLRHPRWGALALPLRALLYVRRQQSALLATLYRLAFRTKLEMAAELVEWAAAWLDGLGKRLWLVADGAYAKRPLLRRARAAGAVVVSRLRKDAALRSVPAPPRPGAPRKRGRPPTYGPRALSLAKRAGHRRGWQTGVFRLYGREVSKTYKTFEATYRPAGGRIRVVLVKESDGWAAFFCTDPAATAAEILEAVADRAAIEQCFKDLKEVHGAGQQQLRHYWANVAAYHLNLWLHALVELWAWGRPAKELVDRSASPWDREERRPSHADRCKALRRQCLDGEIQEAASRGGLTRKMRSLMRRLVKLAI